MVENYPTNICEVENYPLDLQHLSKAKDGC